VLTTPAGQLYLKVIFQLTTGGRPVGTTALAERLGVAPPSASGMVRRLVGDGLVERVPRGGVRLTSAGEKVALEAVRRHRLLETFLHEVLGFPWDEVHDEAERLEPGASTHLMDRIEDVLGHPEVDPHGDPIPRADLVGHHEDWPSSLLHAPVGEPFVVRRVSDRQPDALRYLAELGLLPGATLDVLRLDPFDGPLWVRAGTGEERAVSRRLAALVFGAAPATPSAAST
jgi:DtxR family Mn-dependent transcriptional regulator